MSPTETLAALESQLADERAKVQLYERKRLAAFKCAAHLVSKIASLREQIERDATLTKSEDG